MKVSKISQWTVLIIGLLIALVGYWNFEIFQQDRKFSKIAIGQQREQVINIMGNPSEVRKCTSTGKTYLLNDCVEIYGYFIFLEYKAVAFDRNGSVIETFHWSFEDGYGKPHEFD